MDGIMSIIIPESMITSIENLSESKNCSQNTIIKLAVAKFLFDQALQTPEVFKNKKTTKESEKIQHDIVKEIPLDKIVSVQYTLDDGRIIHIIRQSKMH